MRYVVWPAYLDGRYTRRMGRRIPRKIASKDVSVEEVLEASKKLGLEAVIEEDKSYPRSWWEHSGRVVIETSKKKSEVLREIALEIMKMRRR
ncbi:signal recognition particle protein Srp19 [Methanosarcinales archaeon]|nr:MAG: signal recognition particle protein Srp19 [Methanosarcinales archaeon]